jgi:NAD(P)-dependent dehydrogenase (short-subunit alcohol dehydrogenase family)
VPHRGDRRRERPVRRPAPRRQGRRRHRLHAGLGAAIARAARGSARRDRRHGPRPGAGEQRRATRWHRRPVRGGRLAVERLCRRYRACDERFGRLDGLVNAAGAEPRGTLDDTSVELWDRLFAVNVRAPFILHPGGRAADAPRGGGSVVNIITMASHGGEPC